MKRELVWLVVSCLIVAILVLTSCAPPISEEEKIGTVNVLDVWDGAELESLSRQT